MECRNLDKITTKQDIWRGLVRQFQVLDGNADAIKNLRKVASKRQLSACQLLEAIIARSRSDGLSVGFGRKYLLLGLPDAGGGAKRRLARNCEKDSECILCKDAGFACCLGGNQKQKINEVY